MNVTLTIRGTVRYLQKIVEKRIYFGEAIYGVEKRFFSSGNCDICFVYSFLAHSFRGRLYEFIFA